MIVHSTAIVASFIEATKMARPTLIVRPHPRKVTGLLKNLRRLRGWIEDGAKATAQALNAVGLEVLLPKVQGFYIWVPLPPALDETAFCVRAAQANIFIAPASIFYADRDAATPPAMRVNVAYGADPRFCGFLREEIANIVGKGE